MRQCKAPTEEQITRIRAKWKRITRLGLPLFVLSFGTVMLVWMCISYVGFTYLFGKQRLLHQSNVIDTVLPCMMILSYIFPLFYYWSLKQAIRRIGPEQATT